MAKYEKVNVIPKQVGQNLNVLVGEEKFTVTGNKEKLQPIKDVIKAYIEKPTQANYKMMMVALKPVTVETEKKIEETKKAISVAKSKAKKAEKESPVEVKDSKKKASKSKTAKKGLLSKVIDSVGKGVDKVKETLKEAQSIPQPKAYAAPTKRRGEY